MTALLDGHIEAIRGNSSDLVSYQNKFKVLAIGTEKRMDTLPDVPTFQELGMKFYPRIARGVAVANGYAGRHYGETGRGLPGYGP